MFFVKIASYLPFWWVYFWFRMTAYFGFYVLKYRRGVVHHNIKKSFPELSYKERLNIEKRFYFQFMEVFAEMTKSYSFKKKDWEERCKIINPEVLNAHLNRKQPVLLISGHVTNWEWPAHSISSQMDYPMEFLYKPLKSKKYETIVHLLRTRHGGIPIAKDHAMREIVKRKKIPRIIGVVGDQVPSIGAEKVWVNFLNQESAFYKSPERIAVAVDYPVYFCDVVRVSKGHYEVTFKPIALPPYSENTEIVSKYAALLQESIRKSPSDYLWSHKRWKYTKEDEKRVLG